MRTPRSLATLATLATLARGARRSRRGTTGLALASLASLLTLGAPRVAHAQALLSESWESNSTARWVASSAVNLYNETGAPTTLRSSVDDGPTEACAGYYARETVGLSGGRVFAKPPVTVKPDTDYCLMAFVRSNADGAPYVGINFSPNNPFGGGPSTDGECWLLGQAGFNNGATVGSYCPPGVTSIGANPENGAIAPGGTTWTWARRNFHTPAAGLPGTFAYVKFEHFCGTSDCNAAVPPAVGPDFDDLRLVEGTCPAAPPADTAPHTPCAGTTPVCTLGGGATNAQCQDCNGNFGSGASRACPTTTANLCVLAGPQKGACKSPCSGDFGTLGAAPCGVTAPFCRPPGDPAATCVACNGDAGSGSTEACPAGSPTCFTAGPNAGGCGKCTSNADCGPGKPRCDIPTGACSNTCAIDADCGGPKSGKVCDANTCADGCRARDGNTCPDGKKCTSNGTEVGRCVDEIKDSDNDGLSDEEEAKIGTNPNKADSDDDLLGDLAEVGPDRQKPIDSDGDGIIDALDTDDDNDGLATRDEITLARGANLGIDVDLDGKPNWLDPDADNDSVPDATDGTADQNLNGKPDFLDATWPAGGVPGPTSRLPANLNPNYDGKFEGGGCVVAPSSVSDGATAALGMAVGFAALGAARRRRARARR